MEQSYWERKSYFKGIDVAVIGSGIVGLTAALHLKTLRPAWRVAVFERGALPAGASTRNAGFACFGSLTELIDDIKHMGEDAVLATVEKRWNGLLRLRQLVGDERMQYVENGGYEMFTREETAIYNDCVEQMGHFNEQIGAITGRRPVYRKADEDLPRFGFEGVRHLILNQPEGQIHTGRTMAALLGMTRAAGIELYNGMDITGIEEGPQGATLHTAHGARVEAAQVLVAVNGFARRLMPHLDVQPARNQVLVTEPIAGLQVEGCFHYDRGYFYFRNLDGRILLGGGRNLDFEGEQTDEFGANERIRTALVRLLHEVICPRQRPRPEFWWTGIMGLGPVKKPIIERVSPSVVVAVRLSGMGVAIGTLVGQEGAELTMR